MSTGTEPQMDTDGHRGRVPKLRFPEFRDDGAWEEKQLGDVCDVKSSKRIHQKDWKTSGIPFYRAREIVQLQRGNSLKDPIFISEEKYNEIKEKYSTPQKNDMLITGVGTIGVPYIIPDNNPFYFKDGNLIWLSNISTIPEWIYLNILNPTVMKNIHNEQGSTVQTFTIIQAKKLKIHFPHPPEQQKIANCVSSIDELISVQAKKLDTLKAHKKGLMQQLFPAEGETVPKLRFPEFRDAGAWEETFLSKVAKYQNGKAHEQNIEETGKYIVVNSKFISTDGEVKKFSNTAACIAEKEDILMVLSDVPNGRAIAKCFLVDTDNLYTVNQRICKLTSKKAVSVMLFYSFNRNPYFLAFDDGVKQTNLKKDDVLNCPILLPKDLNEQQKIADCLISIDNLITAQAKKLDTLKSHKKGLMQQLFPTPDEVNG